MHELVDEVAVLNRWLGRVSTTDAPGELPDWSGFRFRDAVVIQLDAPDCWGRMYLVRGDAVREFVLSQDSIDQAYLRLVQDDELPVVA